MDKSIDAAEQAIVQSWIGAIRASLSPDLLPDWQNLQPGSRIDQALQQWSESCPRPLVILIDEIDSLQDEVLIAVLRQLRSGYPRRPKHFPQSVALIGMRDVRDYKISNEASDSDRLNTASPFNVKVESLILRNFTLEEVAELYGQHTIETGQQFTEAAIALAFDLTQGQPWLVNAIAKEITENLVEDITIAIIPDHIEAAKEILIRHQDTHLDSLAARLREPRVKAIIEPMLSGRRLGNIPNNDIRFVLDLGLCRMNPLGGIMFANPIYREVFPRILTRA